METYGILSILPIILAISMAIKTRNVIISLFASLFLGKMMLLNYNPIETTKEVIFGFTAQLTDSYNAGVIVLMLFIGGFIEIMMHSGGAYAFAQKAGVYINSKFKAQFSAYIAGIMIFFSDLGTPLIVGPVFSPFFKKFRVSKEKLAFILDSTASPVAVLVPFIGWGVFIIGLIQKEFELLTVPYTDYEAFIKAIPFNIYPILAVTIIPVLLSLKLDFGLMKKFEDDADKEEVYKNDNQKEVTVSSDYIESNAKAIFVWLPILVLLATLFLMLGVKFITGQVPGSQFRVALSSGYFYATVVLIALMLINKTKTFKEIFKTYMSGMYKMTDIAVTLILAWSLGALNKDLGTALFIINFIKDAQLNPAFIPIITFVLGAIISFATGSSWGTYSIMIPIIVPLAVGIDAPLLVTIAAVLSGGLFGDHVSPISVTTILSSVGAGCDHINHVKTQMPYAILNASIAGITFIVAGFSQNYIYALIAVAVQIVVLVSISVKQKVQYKKG